MKMTEEQKSQALRLAGKMSGAIQNLTNSTPFTLSHYLYLLQEAKQNYDDFIMDAALKEENPIVKL